MEEYIVAPCLALPWADESAVACCVKEGLQAQMPGVFVREVGLGDQPSRENERACVYDICMDKEVSRSWLGKLLFRTPTKKKTILLAEVDKNFGDLSANSFIDCGCNNSALIASCNQALSISYRTEIVAFKFRA